MNEMNDIPLAWKNTSDLFIALGDAQRQRILLSFEKEERMNILQIVAHSKLGRTAVTHHLKLLKQSGALDSEKVGKEVFFWVNKDFMINNIENVLAFIKEYH